MPKRPTRTPTPSPSSRMMIVMLTPARRTDSERPVAADSAIFSGPEAGGNLERRSEEHTSELQSRLHLVCRLLLEKKKKICATYPHTPTSAHVNLCLRVSSTPLISSRPTTFLYDLISRRLLPHSRICACQDHFHNT